MKNGNIKYYFQNLLIWNICKNLTRKNSIAESTYMTYCVDLYDLLELDIYD